MGNSRFFSRLAELDSPGSLAGQAFWAFVPESNRSVYAVDADLRRCL
jgi:hypothetical protein